MQVEVGAEELAGALALVQGAMATSKGKEKLQNFLLRAGDGALLVVATDLDITKACRVKANVVTAGSTLVGRQLATVSEGLVAPAAILRRNEAVLEMQAGGYSATLAAAGPEDFPEPPVMPERKKTVPRADLLHALRRVSIALCKDGTKRALCNVRFDREGLVSSDTHTTVLVEMDPGVLGETLVPVRAAQELTALLKEVRTPEVEVARDDNHFFVRVEGVTFSSRLGVGPYPDLRTRGLEPSAKAPMVWKVHREGLRMALERVSRTASKKSRSVRIDLTRSSCNLAADDFSGNKSKETLDCEFGARSPDGRIMECDPLTVCFDHQILSDALGVLVGETVDFKLAPQLKIPVRLEEPGIILLVTRMSLKVLGGDEEKTG